MQKMDYMLLCEKTRQRETGFLNPSIKFPVIHIKIEFLLIKLVLQLRDLKTLEWTKIDQKMLLYLISWPEGIKLY